MRKVMLFLIMLMLFITPLNVYAVSHVYNYTIGERYFRINVSAGKEHEFYLPFDTDYMEIRYYSSEDDTVRIDINGAVSLFADITENGEVAGVNTPDVVRKGNCTIKISSDSINQAEITFRKVSQEVSYSGPGEWVEEDRPTVEFTDFEDAIRTAVIINKNYPVILVNGAQRYINYSSPSETPYCFEDKVYLPVETFARAFGCYYEVDGDYFLLRTENIEFLLDNDTLYVQHNGRDYIEIPNNSLKKDDRLYIPVDFYAHATGRAVEEKDGYIISDISSLVNRITQDEIMALVKEKFSEFKTNADKNIYYVSQKSIASDSNPGTQTLPFRTLAKACEVADAGDRVIIDSGTYREVLKPSNSGTPDNPIVFEAAPNACVVISALEEIKNTPLSENGLLVYDVEVDLGEGRNMLFFNGDAVAEARHPNTHTSMRPYPYSLKLSPLWPTQGNIQVTLDGTADTATSETDLNQEDNFWEGATLVTVHGSAYGVTTAKITSSEKGKIFLGKKSTRLWHKDEGSDTMEHYDYAYITNSLNAVDAPGEWYMSEGKLYLYPFDDYKKHSLEMKCRQLTVDLSDRECVQLVGINTLGGGMKLNGSRMCVINGGSHKYISHYTYTDDSESGFIDTRSTINDIYDSNAAVYRGEVGIYLSGRDNVIANTVIEHSAWCGVILDGAYNYIENNLISQCGYMGGKGVELFGSPLENITIVKGGHGIYNNTIEKTGRASMSLSSWTYPYDQDNGLMPWVACEVAYNDLMDSNICTRDNGTLYAYGSILGDERKKLSFHHNLIGSHHVTDGYGAGIYWDNYSQMIESHNNIVFYDDTESKTEAHMHIASPTRFPDSFGYIDHWNTVNKGYTMFGKEGLTIDDYPLGKWFGSGYGNKGRTCPDDSQYLSPAVIRGNKIITTGDTSEDDTGAYHLNTPESTLTLTSVDFGTGAYALGLVYTADRYNTGDVVTLTVGGKTQEITLDSYAANIDSINEQIFNIDGITGITDVTITCKEYKSAGILGITVKDDVNAVNNSYKTNITDDNDNYYISGIADANAKVYGAIYKDNSLLSSNVYDTDDTGNFSLEISKGNKSGAYCLKLFSWDGMIPLRKNFEYTFPENKYKNPYRINKFKNADEYPRLISDHTVVSTYGGNERIVFKNIDFDGISPDSLTVKYGLDQASYGKFTVRVYLDNVSSEPILTYIPESTDERWKRLEVTYNLDSIQPITGQHDLYFVIEGRSELPMHMDFVQFNFSNN